MMQFFVLGRNPELSKLEIVSYLKARELEFKEILYKENFLILEVADFLNIQELGGVLMTGRISFRGNLTDFNKFIDKDEVVPADKFSYCVIGNFEELEERLIDKFKEEGKKAMIRRHQKKIDLQEGDSINFSNAEYKLFCLFTSEIFFGLIEQDYDYKEIKNRDMNKPIRREELAISPRLSKILINLSYAKKGDLIFDPFCGIGGILIEALIKGINVFGMDIDKRAISGARQNLKWLEKTNKLSAKYELLEGDSRSAPDKKYNAIVAESSLGELVKKKPPKGYAIEIIQDFEKKIIPVLQRLKNIKKSGARIAITFPYINEVGVNVNHVCTKTGLHLVEKPIKEFRAGQFIGREILVFV